MRARIGQNGPMNAPDVPAKTDAAHGSPARRARPAVARPAHFGDRGLQFPLPVLHAGRSACRTTTVPRRGRAAVVRRDRNAGARASSALGVSKLRLTGGEPLLRKRIAGAGRAAGAIRGRRGPRPDHQRLAAGAQARALRDAGLQRLTVSLDALDPASLPRACPAAAATSPTCWPASRRRSAPASRRSSSTASSQRGVNEDQVLPLLEHFRGTRPRAALHRVHGRGHLQRLARATRWCRRRELRDRIARALAAACRWRELPRRSRQRATPSATGRARSASSVRSASRSAAIAIARRVSADGRLYTCLFAADGHDLRPPLAQGEDRRPREHRCGASGAARRPLQRTARRANRQKRIAGERSRCT